MDTNYRSKSSPMVLFRFTLTFYGETFAPEPFVAALEALGAVVDWGAENNEQTTPCLEVLPAHPFSTNPNVDNHLQWFMDVLDALRWSKLAGQKKDVYFFCYDSQKKRVVARSTTQIRRGV